jgi:tetratricopeptide (TPR) repeat protein
MSISKTFFALLIVSSFAVSFAFAQRTNTKRKTQPRTTTTASSTTDTKSRERRTTTTSTPEAATAQPAAQPSPVTVASPESSPATESKPTEKPAEKTPEKQPEAGGAATTPVVKDPIQQLRDQIDAATTSQDKIRLQLELAEQLVKNGKRSEAVAELQSITTVDVFDPQAFYNTGNALARLGETKLAVVAYRMAIEQRKGRYSRASNNLGVILMRAGKWDEAQEAFLSALRVENFRYAEASYNLGRLYAARGETDLAIREWRRALAVNPQHTAAAQSIARAGNEDQIVVLEQPANGPARDSNARLTPVSTSPRVSEKEPVTSTSPGPINKTPARSSKQTLALDPTSFNFLQKARSASERGNNLEAVDNYQRLISRQNGYFGPANLELGYVLITLKRTDEAMTTLLAVANREGARYPISYYHLARLYEGRGEFKLAEEAFLRAAAGYRNENIQFLLDLSRIREKQSDFKGALEAMEQFVSLARKDGLDVAWSEERLAALRQKTTGSSPK